MFDVRAVFRKPDIQLVGDCKAFGRVRSGRIARRLLHANIQIGFAIVILRIDQDGLERNGKHVAVTQQVELIRFARNRIGRAARNRKFGCYVAKRETSEASVRGQGDRVRLRIGPDDRVEHTEVGITVRRRHLHRGRKGGIHHILHGQYVAQADAARSARDRAARKIGNPYRYRAAASHRLRCVGTGQLHVYVETVEDRLSAQ